MDVPIEHLAPLLQQAGLREAARVEPLSGGGNNRVYRVTAGDRTALLKAYFQHPDDPRDRLKAEFSFCRVAWDAGLRDVPQPLASDPVKKLGLYEFIEGAKLQPGEVKAQHVEQAVDFYRRLNAHRAGPAARELADASEACFSLAQHMACVDRRLTNLQTIDATSATGQRAMGLAMHQIWPTWKRIQDKIVTTAARWSVPLDEPIAPADRRLSPSDFGFHNAILTTNGKLRFIDFEYAGWDDPAKTVCDLFCQPAVPVPVELFDHVATELTADLSNPPLQRERVSLLLPVYGLKWCGILLNEFLPVGSRRRSFARDPQTEEPRRQAQLLKVEQALQRIRI